MKKYLVDTNVVLRLILKDDEKLYQQANKFFQRAKNKEIQIILIPEIVFELNYVLRGFYKLQKKETTEILLKIIKTPYLKIEKREILIEALYQYQEINVDLFDIYLFLIAEEQKATLYSFDKDFKKIV